MARLRDLVLDPWTPLSYKRPLANPGLAGEVGGSYLTPQERRRLTAYTVLQSYVDTVARTFLMNDDSDDLEHREYGDPGLLVRQTMALLLGDSQTISVPGADDFDPDADDAPDPEEPGEDADDDTRRQFDREARRRQREREKNAAAGRAARRQEWLQEWADAERLPLKLTEGERHSVGLGDGVYLLAWDGEKQRPTVTVINPGFYFPVLPESLSDQYPTRVHLAWEIAGDAELGIPDRLRRVTYELGPIRPQTVVDLDFGDRVRRFVPFLENAEPPLQDGDSYDDQGRIVRRYPWNDRPVAVTCYMTEAEWDLNTLDRRYRLDSLPLSTARFMTNGDGELLDAYDLRLDFLPIVHVPNTVALAEHYGRSILTEALQLLDELAGADTDESAASATTGTPPIGLSGASMPSDNMGKPLERTLAPGEVWNLGPDGALSTIDTSPALEALANRGDRLMKRLSSTTRLPQVVLGQVDPTEVPSGFAIDLTFGPARALRAELLLSRGEKYPLLLKFVQRMALAAGLIDGEVLPASITFGSYLPSDLDAVVERVVKLLGSGAISLETGVGMLRDAGLPIDDVSEEVERIQSRMFDAANRLADATGDQDLVREFLGLAPAEDEVQPITPLPATVDPLTGQPIVPSGQVIGTPPVPGAPPPAP